MFLTHVHLSFDEGYSNTMPEKAQDVSYFISEKAQSVSRTSFDFGEQSEPSISYL